jgi:hypothetical protein
MILWNNFARTGRSINNLNQLTVTLSVSMRFSINPRHEYQHPGLTSKLLEAYLRHADTFGPFDVPMIEYSDISFEVPNKQVAIRVVNLLNFILPAATESWKREYLSPEPRTPYTGHNAMAQSYVGVEMLDSPSDWSYHGEQK